MKLINEDLLHRHFTDKAFPSETAVDAIFQRLKDTRNI